MAEPYVGQEVFVHSINPDYEFGMDMIVFFVDDQRVRLRPKVYGNTPVVEYKRQEFIDQYMS